jgi:peroxiredoxin
MLIGSEYKQLKHGDKAPDFSLPATDGKIYSLSDFVGKPLLVIFMCNHCPYVLPKIEEIKRITTDFRDKITVVAINPNEDENYPEDSFEKMQEYMKEWDAAFIYLRDETQDVARAYGAVCTPDPFLFDGKGKLLYHGRIDDTHGKVEGKHELYEVISEFLIKDSISHEEKPSMGCSIKWKGI